MNRVVKLIILLCVAAGIFTAVFFGMRFFRNKLLLDNTSSSQNVSEGNSGGNLYNGGMFCEKNGIVYFANPNDNYSLYSMNAFGGDQKKLCADSVAYINVDDNYIYYTRRAGSNSNSDDFMGISAVYQYALCRVNLDGTDPLILDDDPCMNACLVGNYIYYLHYDSKDATTVYRIGIDGKNKERVSEGQSLTCSAHGDVLYYNGTTTDHNLYALNSTTGNLQMIYEGNAWQPTYSNGYLYFLNLNDNYSICRINLSTYEAITVVDKSVQNFNVYGNSIYYQTQEGDIGLYMSDLNGENEALISYGNCCEICVTSSYLYFRKYEVEDIYYRTMTNSEVNVETFVPVLGNSN